MQVICLEEMAFYAQIEQVVDRLQDKHGKTVDKWIDDEQAMRLLNIKSRTTLQKLRDEGKSGVVSSSDIVNFKQEIMKVTGDDLTPLMNTKDWTPRRQACYHKLQERGSKLLFSTNQLILKPLNHDKQIYHGFGAAGSYSGSKGASLLHAIRSRQCLLPRECPTYRYCDCRCDGRRTR